MYDNKNVQTKCFDSKNSLRKIVRPLNAIKNSIKQKYLMTNIRQTKMSDDIHFSGKHFAKYIDFYSGILCFQEPFESVHNTLCVCCICSHENSFK